jgi:hypothetical protein
MRVISSLSNKLSNNSHRSNKHSPGRRKNVLINKNANVGQKKQWPKYTLGLAMDKPCCFHTFQPDKPVNHLTRNCSWLDDILAGRVGPFGLARPPVLAAPSPLTGANTIGVPPRPANPGNQNNGGNADVHQVEHNYNPTVLWRRPSRVFETEKTDKQGLYRWSFEVNAVLSALPR